jgi:hypothetical protein
MGGRYWFEPVVALEAGIPVYRSQHPSVTRFLLCGQHLQSATGISPRPYPRPYRVRLFDPQSSGGVESLYL